jgi:hypothetical protein
MANPKVLNQAQIDAAKAAKQEATNKATAAKAIGAPIAEKVIPTIPKTAAALNALAKAMQGNDPNAIAKAQADADAAIAANKSSATKEELAIAKQSTLDYQKYLDEAAGINIPEARYGLQESDTGLENRRSAYNILMEEFTRYGLGALVEPLKDLVMDNVSPSEFSLRLQQTDAYKKRFSANADRIAKGLTALKPAEYLAMEDSYQNIMRNYGLPASYYSKDSLGTQAGFNQLLANDVSAVELEDRVMTAQNRVQNANPEVYKALKAFYPDITNGDILAYTLDPTKALDAIKRKVTAAEIGGAALSAGLTTEAATAENLARYGVTKQQAEQGYQAIGGMLPRASQLADIYKQNPYTQAVAESEVFGTGNAVSATERRKKLTALETAKFSGSSGMAGNALSRDRASSAGVYRESGAGSF